MSENGDGADQGGIDWAKEINAGETPATSVSAWIDYGRRCGDLWRPAANLGRWAGVWLRDG